MTYRVDKGWVRDQERMRRHGMRRFLCFVGWLPLLATGMFFVYDWEQDKSIFEIIPALRDIDPDRWLAIWGWIALGCVVFGALVMLALWRCPGCSGFLPVKELLRKCPRCGAKLHEPRWG